MEERLIKGPSLTITPPSTRVECWRKTEIQDYDQDIGDDYWKLDTCILAQWAVQSGRETWWPQPIVGRPE